MQQSVTYDTTEDDAGEVLLAVAYSYGYDSVEELLDDYDAIEDAEPQPSASGPAVAFPGGWSHSKMSRYVKVLKPTAKKVLRAIAENAPMVDVGDVQTASGVSGYTYAGSMSSFGFAVNNTRGVNDKPFVKIGNSYEMHPDVATLALSVLDELGF